MAGPLARRGRPAGHLAARASCCSSFWRRRRDRRGHISHRGPPWGRAQAGIAWPIRVRPLAHRVLARLAEIRPAASGAWFCCMRSPRGFECRPGNGAPGPRGPGFHSRGRATPNHTPRGSESSRRNLGSRPSATDAGHAGVMKDRLSGAWGFCAIGRGCGLVHWCMGSLRECAHGRAVRRKRAWRSRDASGAGRTSFSRQRRTRGTGAARDRRRAVGGRSMRDVAGVRPGSGQGRAQVLDVWLERTANNGARAAMAAGRPRSCRARARRRIGGTRCRRPRPTPFAMAREAGGPRRLTGGDVTRGWPAWAGQDSAGARPPRGPGRLAGITSGCPARRGLCFPPSDSASYKDRP
jgi:hypothetical protein